MPLLEILSIISETRVKEYLLRSQLFGKMNELETQLTSDEPKENVDASPTLLARQLQLKDAILSASLQLENEAHGLLDQLKKVLSDCSFRISNPFTAMFLC